MELSTKRLMDGLVALDAGIKLRREFERLSRIQNPPPGPYFPYIGPIKRSKKIDGTTLTPLSWTLENGTYFFPVAGCEKDFVFVEIEDGNLKVTASGKVAGKDINHEYSVEVGSASLYDITATYTAGLLAVELKKKSEKVEIAVK